MTPHAKEQISNIRRMAERAFEIATHDVETDKIKDARYYDTLLYLVDEIKLLEKYVNE